MSAIDHRPRSTAASPIRRVCIVEDHTLLAESVGFVLRSNGLDVNVAPLDDGETTLATIVADESTLVLLDLDLGAGIGDGTSLLPALLQQGADVLVVTGTTDRTRIAAAIHAGAIGFVTKDQPFEVLLEVVLRASRRERVLGDADRHELLAALRRHRARRQHELAPFEALTSREQQVLDDLGRGKSVDAIARERVVSAATVRTQVRGLLTKLGVRSQLAAVAKARDAGWLPGSD